MFLGVEVPLGNVPLTSFGSDKSNYVTADELASTWHKLGIDATDEEVENFIEVCLVREIFINILDFIKILWIYKYPRI